ncbi:MAG: cation diffusion facilitator family transporter [Verrucomicrobiota bacterium]|nr:cation diffusion facilitator family transporter [Verrucomicrobiota bacterium]
MPRNRLQRSLRATFLGMALNTLLAAAKLSAGIIGNSYALIADAVESLADIFSSIIVWRALVVAAEPADENHPYGHGKAEPMAAAIVSTILLLAAVGIAIQAVREIILPRHGPAGFTLIILLCSMVIKEGLFRFVLREGTEVDSSAVRTDAWHHRSDAITSLAAAIGISIALIGGKGFEAADSAAAIVAAGIIAWNGWRLLRPAMDELMDAAPSKNFNAQVEKIAREIPGVDAVEKCVARKMGYHYFVDMHVEVAPEMSVAQAHQIAHRVKDKVRETMPAVSDVLVHIEPLGTAARKSP